MEKNDTRGRDLIREGLELELRLSRESHRDTRLLPVIVRRDHGHVALPEVVEPEEVEDGDDVDAGTRCSPMYDLPRSLTNVLCLSRF